MKRWLWLHCLLSICSFVVVDGLLVPMIRVEAGVGRRQRVKKLQSSGVSSASSSSSSSSSLPTHSSLYMTLSEELKQTRERNKQLGRGLGRIVAFTVKNAASMAKQIFVYSVSMTITWSFIQTRKTITIVTSKLYATIIDFLTWAVGYTLMAMGKGIKLAVRGGKGEEIKEGEVVQMAKKDMYRLDNKNEEDQLKEQERYKIIFEEIDSNRDERISLDELKVYMKSKFDNISDADIKVMMEEADHDNNKSLDLPEFITAMKKSITFETTYAWRLAQAAANNDSCLQ